MATIAATLGGVTLFAGCASHHAPDSIRVVRTARSMFQGPKPGRWPRSPRETMRAPGLRILGRQLDDPRRLPEPGLDGPDGGAAAAPSNAPALFGRRRRERGAEVRASPSRGPTLLPAQLAAPSLSLERAGGAEPVRAALHTANQKSDLAVYTASTSWTMPKALWDLLRLDSNDAPITVTIRGGTLSGGKLATSRWDRDHDGVAPADAPGTIVYWTSADGTDAQGLPGRRRDGGIDPGHVAGPGGHAGRRAVHGLSHRSP